jgi:Acetyltransferase (GNAT) domain
MSQKTTFINFCNAGGRIPVFLQPWWQDAVCRNWDVALVWNGDAISGVWVYQQESKLGVQLVRTPMLTPYTGAFVLFPPDLKPSRRDGFEYETVKQLLLQLPPAPYWNVALRPGFKQAGLLTNSGFQLTVRQTFLLNLTLSEADLYADLNANTRKNIRVAAPEYEITNNLNAIADLFRFHEATLHRKHRQLPYGAKDLALIVGKSIENGAGALWVARNRASGTTDAVIWQVWDAGCSYYVMGAQNPVSESKAAMTVLLWHAILHARNTGIPMFDFEGSSDAGVEKFFRNFGAARELYPILYKNEALVWKAKELLLGR